MIWADILLPSPVVQLHCQRKSNLSHILFIYKIFNLSVILFWCLRVIEQDSVERKVLVTILNLQSWRRWLKVNVKSLEGGINYHLQI